MQPPLGHDLVMQKPPPAEQPGSCTRITEGLTCSWAEQGQGEHEQAELQALFPPELQPFVKVHNFAGNLASYPRLQAARAALEDAGPGPANPYLAEVCGKALLRASPCSPRFMQPVAGFVQDLSAIDLEQPPPLANCTACLQ